MMVTNRDATIGFALLCECVFSSSTNLKGHQKFLSKSTKTNSCVFMTTSNTMTFKKARMVYAIMITDLSSCPDAIHFHQLQGITKNPFQVKFKKHLVVWYQFHVCSYNYVLPEKHLSPGWSAGVSFTERFWAGSCEMELPNPRLAAHQPAAITL